MRVMMVVMWLLSSEIARTLFIRLGSFVAWFVPMLVDVLLLFCSRFLHDTYKDYPYTQ